MRAFFFHSDERRNLRSTTRWEENTFGGAFQAITFCPTQTGDDFDNGIVTPSCIAALPELFTPNRFFVNERNRTTSVSGFADGNFELTDTLTILGGLRWTYDRKQFDAVTGGDPDFFWNPAVSDMIDPVTGVQRVGQTIEAEDSWDEVTYRIGLQYQPTPDLNFYALRSTGFRSGVFDAAQSDAALAAVAPETVTSNEIGAKTCFLDNRVQFSRLRGRIETVLDSAKARGYRQGENPARWRGHLAQILPVRTKLSRGHHKAMAFDAIPAFIGELHKREAVAALALEFAILTAARTGEVIAAKWSGVDLDKAVWTVPAERMKAGKEHRVPLSPRALAMLEGLKERASQTGVPKPDLSPTGP